MSRPTPGRQKPRQKNPASAKTIIPSWGNKPEIDAKEENVRASLKFRCVTAKCGSTPFSVRHSGPEEISGATHHTASCSKGAARPPACCHVAGGGISRSAVAAWMSTSRDSDKGWGVCAGGHVAAAGKTGALLQEPTWKAPLCLRKVANKAYSTLCMCLSCPSGREQ